MPRPIIAQRTASYGSTHTHETGMKMLKAYPAAGQHTWLDAPVEAILRPPDSKPHPDVLLLHTE